MANQLMPDVELSPWDRWLNAYLVENYYARPALDFAAYLVHDYAAQLPAAEEYGVSITGEKLLDYRRG